MLPTLKSVVAGPSGACSDGLMFKRLRRELRDAQDALEQRKQKVKREHTQSVDLSMNLQE